MTMRTMKVLTIWFSALFGVIWAYLSWKNGEMYIPPSDVKIFLVGLISGKWAQSYNERKGVTNNAS